MTFQNLGSSKQSVGEQTYTPIIENRERTGGKMPDELSRM